MVPKWPTHVWWPMLMSMIIQQPILLPKRRDTLFLPSQPQEVHKLHKTMTLMFCHLSGDSSKVGEFHRRLQRSCSNLGDQERRSSYTSYINKWKLNCDKRSIDPLYPAVEDGINFLAKLFKTGIGYSCINTARSALSSIILLADNIPFDTHPLVSRFLKGTFVARPSLPTFNDTWDVADVFKHLTTQHPAKNLNLKDLTLKVTMLLMLLSGERCQTIHALTLESMPLRLRINVCLS